MDTPGWVSHVRPRGSVCATCTGSMEQGKEHLGRDNNFYSESGKGSGPSLLVIKRLPPSFPTHYPTCLVSPVELPLLGPTY